MWLITPTHAVVIVFLTWVLLCWVRIWSFTPGQGRLGTLLSAVLTPVRGVVRVLFAFFGMYLLDIVIRICFLGMFSYGRLGYIIVPILLCIVLGASYIFCSTFLKPSWATLLAFGGMAPVYLYMTIMLPTPELRISLYVGVVLALVFSVIEIVWVGITWGTTHKQDSTNNLSNAVVFSRPIWDLSRKFTFLAGAKVYVYGLILITAELVLQFEGMSLLYWL